jgi:hypothetical protein
MTSSGNHINWRYLAMNLGAQVFAILALAAIAYLFKLPISVVGSGALTIILATLLVNKRGHFGKRQIAGLVWLTVATLILFVLFVIREFVSPIRVTMIHVAILLLPPLLLINSGRKPK